MRFTLRPKLVFVATFITLGSGILQSTVAVDFAQCMADFRNGTYGSSGGVDVHGQPVEVSQAVGMTYGLCKRACGTGPEAFDSSKFAQRFNAWLLPWLALVSQLPFGAKRRVDNLMSMLLAVGSPTLAAYSLTLTLLNGRWVARRFSGISYPNVNNAFLVMISLQQVPLQIMNEAPYYHLSSLVVLPENDRWWRDLVERLDYTHTWSISASASIAWVFVAYIFTVINGFTSLKHKPNADMSDGQAVGSLWLWLLPVVISWLQISPKCDNARLKYAMARANDLAYVARPGCPSLASATSEDRALKICDEEEDTIYDDEECTAPIYNYARFLPFTQAVDEVVSAFRSASNKARRNMPVNRDLAWHGGDQIYQIHPDNRRGTAEQVNDYCAPPQYVRRSHWGPDVLSRFLLASFAGLSLQWCTAGAAIIILWFTPTVGLGCRSASFFIYAGASTLVWMLLVTSSILTHYSSPRHRHFNSTNWKHVARALAKMLRRLGKLLAAFNTVWIVLACVLQFANFYSRCYCNSGTIPLGNDAYNVILIKDSDVWASWIGGVTFACVSAVLFIGFVNIFVNPQL